MKNFFIASAILIITTGNIGNTNAATPRMNKLQEFAILECRSVIPVGQGQRSIRVINFSRTPGIPNIPFDQNEINCADAVTTITKQGFPILETTIFDSTGTVIVMTFGR